MTRGFITIATGKKHYYKIASNLLLSYRYFSKDPMPFAIIAEEENEYTAMFDDVIITKDATRSFMDKMLLLKLCPYDETIFLDADSLAYGDLNVWWDVFKDATDFSSIGTNVDKNERSGAWYNIEDIGEYGEKLEYKVHMHAGICFIRKSNRLKQLYEDCMHLSSNFEKLHFHTCPHSKDECIFGVAMPMNQMKTVAEPSSLIAVYPCLTYIKANIYNDVLEYATPWGGETKKGLLVHWGTAETKKALYRFEQESLMRRLNNKEPSFYEKIMYKHKLRLVLLRVSLLFSKIFRS